MRFIFLFLIGLLVSHHTYSQSNKETFFITIGKQKVSTEEFERIFNKNNSISSSENQTIEEYLEMFINFKLKVQAATDAGMDTLSSFKNELKGYRDQLAKTYLTDNKAADSLIVEAYQRMHTEVSASHIMIGLNINASPFDTLAAWNKIMGIRQRIINGETFEKLAYELSTDPSAKNNKGNLGYYTAFQLPYSIESAILKNKVGETSMPVRSSMGYHIIKTTDKRPARGEVKVSHIMLMVPQGSADSLWLSTEKRIKEIETKLKAGADFGNMAREFSEDRGSARNGGDLPPFGAGKMVPEFDAAAFKLKNPGDISEPVKTFYGWHIIKLIEKTGIPEFEKIKQDLKSRISKDERANIASNSFINKLKKEYSFAENTDLLAELYNSSPSEKSIATQNSKSGTKNVTQAVNKKANNSLNLEEDKSQTNKELFHFADESYKLSDFISYIKTLSLPDSTNSALDFVQKSYATYVKDVLLDYENNKLESKNPDFKNLIQEYHDGILLFNLSDSLVWSKASKDSAGLQDYYQKNKASYLWPVRLEATVVKCSSLEIAKKALKISKNIKDPAKIESGLAKAVCDSNVVEPCLALSYGKFAKGENAYIDSIPWKKGYSRITNEKGSSQFAIVYNVLDVMPKSLDEVKGLAISDYQNFLDREWVNTLRKQYQITIDNDILNELKRKYAGKQ